MSTPSPCGLSLSVVVPFYNEQDNVGPLAAELHAALAGREYELIFVDDGSTDDTVARIPQGPGMRILRFEENAGQSAAMLAGIRAAEGEVIVLMDGDRQNDPADIPLLLEALDAETDLVCGYRRERRDSVSKRLSSRIANAVRNAVIGDGIRDTGCTLKAMRRECRDALTPFRGMHRFIPALIGNAGYRIREVGVSHRPRTAGVSKYGVGNRALRATLDMLGVWWLGRRQVHYRLKRS